MSRVAPLCFGCVCAIALVSTAYCRADDQPKSDAPMQMQAPSDAKKAIKAEEAKDNIGKEVVVEFVVVAGRELEDRGICFLNSSSDQSDPTNFTVFITKNALTKMKEDGKIDHPADHFNQKKVQVSGKVERYKEKAEIKVNSPDQIKIVDEEKKPEEKKM